MCALYPSAAHTKPLRPLTRLQAEKLLVALSGRPKARILATDTTVMIGNLTFVFAKTGKLERVTVH